ncbi:HlyD family secretion protein [Dyella sp.]|uniref:HlyD family secretion protein n=1 Tax=Dyella sp. TaxID=1869338 RepID=UPI002ED1DFDC
MSAVAPAADLSAAPRRVGKRQVMIGLGVVAVVSAGAWGVSWWTTGRFIESTDDAYVGADITAISPKVSGYITQLVVSDNQAVRAGDLLARIDDRDYRASLQKAQAAIAAQQAWLANLDANERLQHAVIDQAHAGVDAAQAESVRAHDDQLRYRDLSARAAVSVESAQRADATAKTARADTEKAQAALAAAQRQLDVIATQKLQAQAALQQAQAEARLAELNVGYTELRAPVDGSIGNRRVRLGAFVEAGTPLMAVVPARGLWIDANFKEDQLAHMQPGQPVEIRADVLPGRVFHGRLGSLAPATGAQFSVLPPENATGNFTKIVQRVPVRVLLDANDAALGALRPGLSVTADVNTQAVPR